MRLTQEEQTTIAKIVDREFGTNAIVMLFGSRVNDSLKGGDIDLYIETKKQITDILGAEMRIYANLITQLGDQRIDLVIRQPNDPIRSIHEQARNKGILL